MSCDLESVIKAMEDWGAKREVLTIRYGGELCEVPAVVKRSAPGWQAREFVNSHARKLDDQSVLVFQRACPTRALTVEELSKLSQEEIQKASQAFCDVYLVLDRNLELQLALLDELKYSDGSAGLDSQLQRCKKLLRTIWEHNQFVLYNVMEGLVVIQLTPVPSRKTVESMIDDIFQFISECGRLEFSRSAYVRDIVRGGAIVL